MSHKADKAFFDRKKEWSRMKDAILEHYLVPYLAKVKELRRPILIVDGFAGPGMYKENRDPGSPLIICNTVAKLVQAGVNIHVLCIEKDEDLYAQLLQNVQEFDFCEVLPGEFANFIDRIREAASSRTTVFLYVDPYTPSSLVWQDLESVFKQIREANASVEVLINFLAPTFHRDAWRELKRQIPTLDSGGVELEDDELREELSESKLDSIVGGSWWKDLLTTTPREEQIRRLMGGLEQRLREYFQEVCYVPVEDGSKIKYFMIFGSRHRDALILMNDAMIKARGKSEFDFNFLFAEQELEDLILDEAQERTKRGDVITRIVRRKFCVYTESEIRRAIGSLLRPPNKRLESATGKAIINDDTEIWKV